MWSLIVLLCVCSRSIVVSSVSTGSMQFNINTHSRGVSSIAFSPDGNFLVSDEYGPSLMEFDRSGKLVKAYTVPANLVPRVGAATDYNTLPPALNHGREVNRGLEGLVEGADMLVRTCEPFAPSP